MTQQHDQQGGLMEKAEELPVVGPLISGAMGRGPKEKKMKFDRHDLEGAVIIKIGSDGFTSVIELQPEGKLKEYNRFTNEDWTGEYAMEGSSLMLKYGNDNIQKFEAQRDGFGMYKGHGVGFDAEYYVAFVSQR